MAKVKKGFFCIQEKKTYSEGEEYTGKRKDLGQYLEVPKKKVAKKTKELKLDNEVK